jgi:hypothetical protein
LEKGLTSLTDWKLRQSGKKQHGNGRYMPQGGKGTTVIPQMAFIFVKQQYPDGCGVSTTKLDVDDSIL